MIFVPHHQAFGKQSDGTFQNAHVDVQLKHGYILRLKKGGCQGDHSKVVCADKFLHDPRLKDMPLHLSRADGTGMGLDEAVMKPHDRLSAHLAGDMDRVNALIRERMASEHAPRIPEVTAHLVEAGGKRLRPLLTLAAARLCGYDGPFHVHLAATVEFIHTATLLHDDVVDVADTRRGQPAARSLWGNAASIFAGDWLLVEALRRIRLAGDDRLLDRMLAIIEEMILAESLQLERRSQVVGDVADYFRVCEGKTAALFRWAMLAGARAGGCGGDAEAALERFGHELGVAFQVIDDCLDFEGDFTVTGKALFADLREGKLTYPLLVAHHFQLHPTRVLLLAPSRTGENHGGDKCLVRPHL